MEDGTNEWSNEWNKFMDGWTSKQRWNNGLMKDQINGQMGGWTIEWRLMD